MKKIILFIAVLVIGAGAITYALITPHIVHPVLKTYGPVYDISFAVEKPDTAMDYKIVVDAGTLTEKVTKPAEIYTPLEHIARMYNLHIYGGVKQENLHMAVVIWGEPITTILNNEAYHKKYGVDNPNMAIISEMKSAGVQFYACGQSVKKFDIDPATVNPDVTIALSRFTAVSTFQLKGYAYFKY